MTKKLKKINVGMERSFFLIQIRKLNKFASVPNIIKSNEYMLRQSLITANVSFIFSNIFILKQKKNWKTIVFEKIPEDLYRIFCDFHLPVFLKYYICILFFWNTEISFILFIY